MKKNTALFAAVLSTLSMTLCQAKPISLYDQPAANAKIIGSIETDHGLIPIYQPQNSDWMKVGDPNNGNIGWIKQSELKNASNVNITQRYISTGNQAVGTQGFQITNGIPKMLSPQETQNAIKKMQEKQKALQKELSDIMSNLVSDQPFPVIMPILVVPTPAPAAPAAAKPPATPNNTPAK